MAYTVKRVGVPEVKSERCMQPPWVGLFGRPAQQLALARAAQSLQAAADDDEPPTPLLPLLPPKRYTWMIVVHAIVAWLDAYGIGANDVAK
jgi:hypothetical protein